MLGWYIFSSKRIRLLGVFMAGFLMLLGWWSTIRPQQDRDWAVEYAKPAYATIDKDLVTIHNIRNFDYRSETDFTPQYYSKTFDLNTLDSVDLIASYWMGDAIAHIMLSFGFGQKEFLAISIETRRERAETYSSIAGFLNNTSFFMSSPMNAIASGSGPTSEKTHRKMFTCTGPVRRRKMADACL